MHMRSYRRPLWPLFALLSILALLLAACGNSAAPSPNQPANVTIGLGYIPDPQFAPFYVAKTKGYYKAAGLNVTLDNGIVTDLIGSMIAGRSNFVFASGDEELTARSKHL